jgi:hypothetical protein
MNRNRLLALFVILGLLAGGVAHVPVALATEGSYSPAYGNIVAGDVNHVMFIANTTRASWTTYYLRALSAWTYGPGGGAGGFGAQDGHAYVDGIETQNYAASYIYCYIGGWIVENMAIVFSIVSGSHTYSWNLSRTFDVNHFTWIGSVPGYDATNYGSGYPGGSTYGPGVWPTQGPPLAVTIDSGPTAVDLVDGGSWHATATGGVSPYNYGWDYGSNVDLFQYDAGTGQTFTKILPAGNWRVGVRVTDSLGAMAYDDITVTASAIANSYQAHLTRSGSLGQYMTVTVTDAAGAPVAISSTTGTKYGEYGQGGGFAWWTADSEAAELGGSVYSWRWTMTFTAGGITINPDADFWFQSSVHLTVPNLNLLVMHHFVGVSDTANPWFPPGAPGTSVAQVVPETPPVVATEQPTWLTPLWDFFVRLFKYLFDPGSTAFSTQLAGSWVTIASPVPSITPQYTIPFPNPNHLLAPTGDSVNISFSGITSYSGYSVYKAIVQALLDAILVFVVISIVT